MPALKCGVSPVTSAPPTATTDLTGLRAVLAQAPLPLLSFDLQDLALSFNLDRPVVNDKNYQSFEHRVRQGEMGYLIISDRALREQPPIPACGALPGAW